MKILVRLLIIALGICLLPALFVFAMGVLGTVLGFVTQPKVMIIIILILAGISIPGLILGFIIKK